MRVAINLLEYTILGGAVEAGSLFALVWWHEKWTYADNR